LGDVLRRILCGKERSASRRGVDCIFAPSFIRIVFNFILTMSSKNPKAKEKGEETKITDEEWFKQLPISERLIWLRIIRNQMLDNLESSSKIVYQQEP